MSVTSDSLAAAPVPAPADSSSASSGSVASSAHNWYHLKPGVPDALASDLRQALLAARTRGERGVVLSLVDALGSDAVAGIAGWVDFVIGLRFQRVMVDLTEADSMTSRIPHEFFRLDNAQSAFGGDTVIVTPSREPCLIASLLERMGVADVVPLFRDVDAAWSHPLARDYQPGPPIAGSADPQV